MDTENYVHQLVHKIKQAAWNSTPNPKKSTNMAACTPMIKQKILDKRRLRKQWQNTRALQVKTKLNKAVKDLKQLLNDEKQRAIQEYLECSTASEATDYSLWKATIRLKQPQTSIPPLRTKEGEWAKSDTQKANVLAEHSANVFKLYTSEMSKEEGNPARPQNSCLAGNPYQEL